MKDKTEWSLASLIERGGVHYNLPGTSPKNLIAGIIDQLPPVPGLDPKRLLVEIMEREALVSTGIGRGIALPHPRNHMLDEGVEPLVALAFPSGLLDWNTHDGSKVHTVFMIISVSAKQHLGALSKINFLCQQEKFYSLIKERAPKDEIIFTIREAETAWAEGKNYK